MSDTKYPCPCCGHLVFSDPPGSDDICLVCFWEDDVTQLRWPQLSDSANRASLREAQQNFARYGASEESFTGDVRPASSDEPLDPGWRPIDESDRFEANDESAPWPEDCATLYYWRATYWRTTPEDGEGGMHCSQASNAG